MPSSSAGLFSTWLYSDMGSTLRLGATPRMPTASMPSASAMASAASTMRARVSGWRGAGVAAPVCGMVVVTTLAEQVVEQPSQECRALRHGGGDDVLGVRV